VIARATTTLIIVAGMLASRQGPEIAINGNIAPAVKAIKEDQAAAQGLALTSA
jgi:hypothetical protein